MKILITKPRGNDVFNTFFTDNAIKEIKKLLYIYKSFFYCNSFEINPNI